MNESLDESKKILQGLSVYKNKSKVAVHLHYNFLFHSLAYKSYTQLPISQTEVKDLLQTYTSMYSMTENNILYMKQSFEYAKMLGIIDALNTLVVDAGVISLKTESHRMGFILGILYKEFEFNSLLQIISNYDIINI